MSRWSSLTRHLAALSLAGVCAASLAPVVSAAAPEVFVSSGAAYDAGYFHCGPADGGFAIDGDWAITRRLTIFSTNDGVPVRDIEDIRFDGRWVNPENGKWAPDKGALTFFDTLNPDGSFATTMLNMHRTGTYLHGAGRIDFTDGLFRGRDAESSVDVAALCAGLAD